MITPKQAYQRLGLILLIFSLLSLAHSLWLPLSQAPDELDHFLYSHFIARNGRLPLNEEERSIAGRKSYLPPLYHGLVTALTGWSNNDNLPYLKLIRNSPRFDLARALFYTEHLVNTEDERPPYRGIVLTWYLGRVVSIIISLGVIVVAFFTTLEIFPKNYRLATMSASILAFVPTFIFISSAMSYEPLLALLIGLYFLFLIKIVKGDPHLRNFIWLGLLAGLAVTTKYASLILPAQIIGVVTYLAWRHDWGWSGWLKRVTLVGLAAILASSWWFLFLMINFNQVDELGPVVGLLKPIIAGGTDTTQNYVAATLTGGKIGQAGEIERPPFWAWVWQIFQSFWFERVGDYPVDLIAPLLIGLVCLLAVIGLARKWQHWPGERILITLFVSHVGLFVVFPLLRFLIQGELSHTAQGRHILFPIATVLPLLMVYSWQSWLPRSTQRYLALALMGGLVGWSMAQLIHIVAYYPPPLPVRTTPDVIAQIPHRLNKTFGDQIILLGYESQVIPAASTLKLSLYWQSPTYADEDYQMEVSLVQNNVTGLKWSAYPTNGRYPTRIWESWEMIRDDWELPLSDLPPGDYQLQVQLRGVDGPLKVEDTDTLILTNITLPETLPIAPDIPLPVVVAGREVIRGVSLWPAATYPRLNLPEYRPRMAISFVWQGQPDKNETVKWLLVDSQGKVFPSQSASPHFEYLIVRPDWQPGLYRLRAEVWQGETVVASQETAPVLTVFNKQPRLLEPPPISYPLEANFANRIKLLGYDLPERSLAPGQGVPITLYWQGLRTVGQDYTFFTKLLDEQHQLWGSLDRFAKDGYKTTHWLENEVVVDKFELPIAANTPPGVYWLNVGLYFGMGQSPVSLPVVLEQQLTDLTSVTFGPIKVGGAPPGVVARDVAPEHRLEVDLADVIRLRGYDMSQINKTLSVKLYWESLASTETDYTVFLHVRNQAGQTVTQMDRLPASGSYPTSLWSPGEVIPDELSVSLPEHLPPGQYSIVTGLYNFATETRLPVAGSTDNSITLSVVEIQ